MDNNITSLIMLFWRQNDLICKNKIHLFRTMPGTRWVQYKCLLLLLWIIICSKCVLFMTAKPHIQQYCRSELWYTQLAWILKALYWVKQPGIQRLLLRDYTYIISKNDKAVGMENMPVVSKSYYWENKVNIKKFLYMNFPCTDNCGFYMDLKLC